MQDFKLENLNSKEFAEQAITKLSKEHNVDFKKLLSNESLSTQDVKRQFTLKLLEEKLKNYDLNKEIDEDEDVQVSSAVLLQHTDRYLQGDPTTPVEPNIAVNKKNYEVIKAYTGTQITDYVFTLSKRLENMSNAMSVGTLAAELSCSSLIAIGVPMGVGVYKAWKAGAKGLQAIKAGIKSIGMKTAIAVVVILLAEILLYLLLEKPEKVLGIVFNNTDHDLYVKDWRDSMDDYKSGADLYMEHGEMVDFPEDNIMGDLTDKTQICARAEDEDPKEYIIYGGIYFADRHWGFYGSEGIMVFTSKANPNIKIAHQFSVPFAQRNGCSIKQINNPSNYEIKKLFTEMANSRKVRYESTGLEFNMVATMNSESGGVVGLVACIDEK